MSDSNLKNIGKAQRRKRLYTGICALIAGVVLSVYLLSNRFHPGWRLLLFIPYWLGALGVLQYQEGI